MASTNDITADELRKLMHYLEARVLLTPGGRIDFEIPDAEEMVSDGLDRPVVDRLLAASWLDDLVTDVRETPDYCEPGAPPEQVLLFARDVVAEYIRKRFQL
jgi:hypothetical protein